ncbi:hypothetical protein RBB75_10425 [Tunturibacter empetritectus]|uniref:Uncharacterized protein n=1 Tax=Tunturiibacter empetritectus TaxID=3069691 RepID=A0AAU7Z8R4_9BACT
MDTGVDGARRGDGSAQDCVGMFVLQCFGTVLSLQFFSVGPAVLSALAALCFMMGAVSMQRSAG